MSRLKRSSVLMNIESFRPISSLVGDVLGSFFLYSSQLEMAFVCWPSHDHIFKQNTYPILLMTQKRTLFMCFQCHELLRNIIDICFSSLYKNWYMTVILRMEPQVGAYSTCKFFLPYKIVVLSVKIIMCTYHERTSALYLQLIQWRLMWLFTDSEQTQ